VKSKTLTPKAARALWLKAQGLDVEFPFGRGAEATPAAIDHLGYVQIDTINVIERSHHHILFTRNPDYAREHLHQAQSVDKQVFEYWTHALAYVHKDDYRFFIPAMEARRASPSFYYALPEPKEYEALLRRIKKDGPLSIRDIDDDVLQEKDHPWASRKPSKKLLNFGFYTGDLVVSKRAGMLKTYDLASRHFGWRRKPKPASEAEFADYLLKRALRAQALISLDSVCYGNLSLKGAVKALIEAAVKRRKLVPVAVEGPEGGAGKVPHWAAPAALEEAGAITIEPRVHILSPFDPLVIQRKRMGLYFGYEHRFEAYVPAAKRVMGYFALPVLVGDEMVATLDLKTNRQSGQLEIKQWNWLERGHEGLRPAIEEELGRFERFQLTPAAPESAEPVPGDGATSE
jgi:uncharacterized protein